MRRRLLRLALVSLALPLAATAMESAAARLESVNGPSTTTRALRHVATTGRRLGRRR